MNIINYNNQNIDINDLQNQLNEIKLMIEKAQIEINKMADKENKQDKND